MRNSVRLGLSVAAALVVVSLLAWSFYSRAAFGTWNPMAQPTRVSYCDRTYLPGRHVTRAYIDATGNGQGVYPLVRVGTTAGFVSIYAKPLPESVRHQFAGPPLPCDMAVYLKVGADDYIAYGISGGP